MARYHWISDAYNFKVTFASSSLVFHLESVIQSRWQIVKAPKMAPTKFKQDWTRVNGQPFAGYCSQEEMNFSPLWLLCNMFIVTWKLLEVKYGKPQTTLPDEIPWLMNCEHIILNTMKTFECMCLQFKPAGIISWVHSELFLRFPGSLNYFVFISFWNWSDV